MTDFDSIWRTQNEIRTVVNAVLGESIWNLSYNERRMATELELTEYLKEEDADALICQFPVPADYDGAGSKGDKICVLSLILRPSEIPCNGARLCRRLVPRGCDQRPKLHKNLQFSNTKQQKSHKK